MSPPRDEQSADPAFTREEAWVAHAALLAACERTTDDSPDRVPADTADPPAITGSVEHDAGSDTAEVDPVNPYRGPIRRIERGDPLDATETALLHDALVDYLGDAPVRDRATGRALLRRTAATIEAVELE